MAQKNLSSVKASEQDRNKNLIKPTWTECTATRTNVRKIIFDYNKLKPVQLDKPVSNLKTISLSGTPVCDLVTVLLPPKPTLVNLVDGSSPHIPSITKVSNTDLPKNPTAIIAANTATNTAANTATNTAANTSTNTSTNTAANTSTNTAANTSTNTAANTSQNTAANTSQNTAANTSADTAANTVKESSVKMVKRTKAKKQAAKIKAYNNARQAKALMAAAAQTAVQGSAQAITPGAAQPTTPGAAQPTTSGAAQTALQAVAQAKIATLVAGQVIQAGAQEKSFTNQQKKKWQKFQRKLSQKPQNKALAEKWLTPGAYPGYVPVINEEPALTETSQDGSSNVITQAGEASAAASTVTTSVVNQGSTIPIIQKPNITLITKKNLQQEMVKQRLNWIKPDGNVPGTSAAPQIANQSVSPSDSPQFVKTPAGLIPGSTIPILENRIVEPTPRTNAGSFFKKAAKPKQPPTLKIPLEYIYRYPKGIPRSFLLQQEKSLEPTGSPITADSPIWPSNPNMNTYQMNANMTQTPTPVNMADNNMNPAISPVFVQTENPVEVEQPYSPSDVYSEQGTNPEPLEHDSESSEQKEAGQKRLSAFQRLGPLSQPKKPKLTINLNLNKEQPVREVVNETDDDPDKYTPVHLRKDIMTSTDETVVKFLQSWPWRKNILVRKSATARTSRSVMILEQEKMEEAYEKDNIYIQISVKGYPSTWTKERVLDAVLDSVRGYSLIPCFTEFYQHECKFLVMRSRSALVVLHKTGFYIHKDGVELAITISVPVLPEQLHFIPKIILRKRIVMGYMDKKLNLSAFTLQDDISHFIYFPLNRLSNQSELLLIQSSVDWDRLVELDLSHNRLTNITGFDLANVTPRLKHLDLSHNYLEKINILLNDRQLPLKTIRLEGNPLCHDYIDAQHYVKVIKMMFPAVVEIDGVPIHRSGELPNHTQNYCPEEAQEVAEKFLEIFFPLFDSGPDHRSLIQGMYDDDATLTITYCYKLRYGQIYRNFRNLFLYARFLDEGEVDSVVGAMAITKLINRWPHTEHDPFTFTVDVLYHTENTTILRISGVLKLTAETLAEDEHLLSFTRTVVLHSEDGTEYKIQNEMIYWHEPSAAAARSAFRVNTVSQKNFNLKIESTTDEDLRDKFLKIFMKLTTMDKKICERCLEINNWNFKLALEHFTKLLKLKNLDSLTQEVQAAS